MQAREREMGRGGAGGKFEKDQSEKFRLRQPLFADFVICVVLSCVGLVVRCVLSCLVIVLLSCLVMVSS